MTSTRARLLASRTRTGSGPKAENSGQNTAPAFSVPRAVMYSSGIRPANTQTRSPRGCPAVRSPLANWLLSRASSA